LKGKRRKKGDTEVTSVKPKGGRSPPEGLRPKIQKLMEKKKKQTENGGETKKKESSLTRNELSWTQGRGQTKVVTSPSRSLIRKRELGGNWVDWGFRRKKQRNRGTARNQYMSGRGEKQL